MSAREFETLLTRIYVDSSARARFKADPCGEALRAGLSEEECAALQDMDWDSLELAARGFAQKRLQKAKRNNARSIRARLRAFLGVLSRTIRSLL